MGAACPQGRDDGEAAQAARRVHRNGGGRRPGSWKAMESLEDLPPSCLR